MLSKESRYEDGPPVARCGAAGLEPPCGLGLAAGRRVLWIESGQRRGPAILRQSLEIFDREAPGRID
jgi:hypothetical protein